MEKLARIVGYVALLVTPAALLLDAVLAPRVSLATLGLGGGLVLVGGVTAAVEREHALADLGGPSLDRTALRPVLAVAAAAGVTYALSVHAGLGPVVASALVGLAAGLGAPDADTAAYCGSFVGMASPAVFPSVEPVLGAGLVAGLAFVAADGAFTGFGGKLGTLALFGCATAGLLTGVEYAAVTAVEWHSAVLVVPVAAAGAVVTGRLSDRVGVVLGSALVGLGAGLSLPALLPGTGALLATAAYCASFVGMSTTDRLDEFRVGLAGALSGVVLLAVTPAIVGAGGKLGTVAFVSCVALAGAGELRDRLATSAP